MMGRDDLQNQERRAAIGRRRHCIDNVAASHVLVIELAEFIADGAGFVLQLPE